MQPETYQKLQENLVMFYTGDVRSANSILAEQKRNISSEEKAQNLQKMCALAEDMKEALEHDDLSSFGSLLHKGWELKRTLASGITNPAIDEAYRTAMENGALGGKLLGAGGGGFLLFFTMLSVSLIVSALTSQIKRQEQLRVALRMQPFPFSFEKDGTSVVYIGDKYWD